MRRPLLAALLGSMPLIAGCYEYVRADSPTTLIGRPVQLLLTDAGSTAEAGKVGAAIEALDGVLLADSAGTYVIAMRLTRSRFGEEADWRGEHVTVPTPYVASILERRYSRSRTTFAGGLAAAGILGATVALRGGGGSSNGGGTPKPVGSQ